MSPTSELPQILDQALHEAIRQLGFVQVPRTRDSVPSQLYKNASSIKLKVLHEKNGFMRMQLYTMSPRRIHEVYGPKLSVTDAKYLVSCFLETT